MLTPSIMRAILAGACYFAIVFTAGFVLGTLRVLLLVPRIGESMAVLLELPAMLAVSWVACRWIIDRLALSPEPSARLIMGGTAFAVLMLAEAGVSVLLLGRTPAGHVETYRQAPALLGLAAQIAFAAFPMLQRPRT